LPHCQTDSDSLQAKFSRHPLRHPFRPDAITARGQGTFPPLGGCPLSPVPDIRDKCLFVLCVPRVLNSPKSVPVPSAIIPP
jgi:hypothetical protein